MFRRVLATMTGAVIAAAGVAVMDTTAGADNSFSFAEAASGAAAGTTGGAGRSATVVSSLADSGPGTLRQALDTNVGFIRFAPGLRGEIITSSSLRVQSDTTIDGRGADITIRDYGLLIDRSWNVIVRNLKLRHISNDGVSVKRSTRVWLDHLDIGLDSAVNPDGGIDVTDGSTGVTISWSRIAGYDKASLLGHATPLGTPALSDITLHHNVLSGNYQRNPATRHGRFLLLNNVISGWGAGPNRGYGMRSGCGSLAHVVGNVFRPAQERHGLYTSEADCDPTRPPASRLTDNDAGGATLEEKAAETVPDLLEGSGLTAEPAGEGLRLTVESAAGWQDVPSAPDPAPTAPQEGPLRPVLTASSPTSVVLSWSAVPGATSYGWQIATCDGVVIRLSSTTALSKPDSNLSPGCYVGAVRYFNSVAFSSWESSQAVLLGGAPPPATTTTTTAPTTTTTTTPPTTTTTTTAPPTTTTTTPTTAPPPASPMVWLQRHAAGSLDITWQPFAAKYYWSIETCSGVQVVRSSTTYTTKEKSGLANGCYIGTVSQYTVSPPVVYRSDPYELT